MQPTELSLASLEIAKLEAVLELMFLAAYADGEVKECEREDFRSHLLGHTRGQLEPDLVSGILTSMEKRLASENREKRFSAIKARIPDERTRRAAIALAAKVVLADGQLHVDEVAFLERAALALDLDPKEAMACLPHEPWKK